MLGFLAGFWTATRRGRRDGFSADHILDLGFWLMLGSVVGARTLYVVSYWEESFAGRPWTEIFMVQQGGLVFYGGLIGGSLATIIYSRVRKLPLWKLADTLAPSLSLGYVFGRIGCLMNGCCYGNVCDAPWAIRFPLDHETRGLPVHPTQIYEAVAGLLLFFFLEWCYRRKRFDGQVIGLYLICYAILRGLIETFRGDYPVKYLFNILTPAQVVSVFILVAGVVLYLALRRRIPRARTTVKAPLP